MDDDEVTTHEFDAKLLAGDLEIASMLDYVPPEILSVFTDNMCQTGPDVVEFAATGRVPAVEHAAALVEPLSVGVWACRKARVGPGSRVLVVGAGPIGLVCLQAAKAFGAAYVAITDVNPRRLELARELGASEVVNVREMSLADAVLEPDVLLECSGNPAAIGAAWMRRAAVQRRQAGLLWPARARLGCVPGPRRRSDRSVGRAGGRSCSPADPGPFFRCGWAAGRRVPGQRASEVKPRKAPA
jgi:hypothetical protein